MKTFILNEKKERYCSIFFSKDEQNQVILNEEEREEHVSLCYFNIKNDEVLFEITEKRRGKRELVGFRIYKKETIKNVEKLIDLLNANNGYWNEEIDKKFPYIAD